MCLGAGDRNWTVPALRPAGGGQPGAEDEAEERLPNRYGNLRLCLASCRSYDTLRGENSHGSEECILKCVGPGSRYSKNDNDAIEFLKQ